MIFKRLLRRSIFSLLAGGLPIAMASAAEAYPIDCAILLCLPGGFPASGECSAARAEVIRRITPWPVEPPLQIWNCPMGASSGVSSIPSDLPAEVRAYRDGIEVWLVSKSSYNTSDGREVSASAMRQFYDDAGSFQNQSVSVSLVPGWVEGQAREHTGNTLAGDRGSFRAVLMRYHDYGETANHVWIDY